MNPRLTRGEYWILQTAVEAYTPLCFLNTDGYQDPDGIEQMFNKPRHGLNRAGLLETLFELFEHGLIESRRDEAKIDLTHDGIAGAIVESRPSQGNNRPTYYGLTQQGGAVWEAFAAPRWDRYIIDSHSCDPNEGTVRTASSSRLDWCLQGIQLFECEIDQESIEVELLEPWEATYWKTLPSGYEARYRWLRQFEHKWRRRPADDPLQYSFGGFCAWRDGWYHWR